MSRSDNRKSIASKSNRVPMRVRFIDRVDYLLRCKSILGRHGWLRNVFRKPYHRILNAQGRGLGLTVGGVVATKVPAEFRSREIEQYEPETCAAIHRWCVTHENGFFIDVGCSLGYISCAVLFSNGRINVVALDADLNSLKATQRVCQYAEKVDERLTLIYALASNRSVDECDVTAAAQRTSERITATGVTGDPGTTTYVCIDPDGVEAEGVPEYRLDQLLSASLPPGADILIKCDVEGAEQIVLDGCSGLLESAKPDLILSVHPEFLPRFGTTVAEIEAYLGRYGYTKRLLATDHEEHWWCSPTDPN